MTSLLRTFFKMKPSRSATFVSVSRRLTGNWDEKSKHESSTTFSPLLDEFASLTDGSAQVAWIKKIRSKLEENVECHVGDISLLGLVLSDLYSICSSRHPLRRAIARLMDSFDENKQNVVVLELSKRMTEILHRVTSLGGSAVDDIEHAMDCIVSLSENFTLGCSCLREINNEILSAIASLLPSQARHAREQIGGVAVQAKAMSGCSASIKAVVTVLQKSSCSKTASTPQTIGTHSINKCEEVLKIILADDGFSKECHSSASLGLLWIYRTKFPREELLLTEVRRLVEESWFNGLSDSSQLSVFYALLVVIPSSFFREDILTDVLFPKLIQQAEWSESSLRLAQARNLAEWTSVVRARLNDVTESALVERLKPTSSLTKQLLDYVWSRWNDNIEGIRLYTGSICTHVFQIEKLILPKDDYESFLVVVLKKIVSVSWSIRGKYKPFGLLVTELGVAKVLEVEPLLPTKLIPVMGEQSTACHAKDLVRKMTTLHWASLEEGGKNAKTQWELTWLDPLLSFLATAASFQRQYAAEFCLPLFFDVNPSMLTEILRKMEERRRSGEHVLPSLITCLKVAKARRFLKRQIGEEETIKNALCHGDEQIRANAFELICSSSKTTEIVADDDLKLIRNCLPLYLNSQSASFRPVVISGIKRILRRIKDSAHALSKRLSKENAAKETLASYQSFLRWYVGILSAHIHPGACFQRATMSISLLSLLWEIFVSDSVGLSFSPRRALDKRQIHALIAGLEDAYEINRQLIIGILYKIPAKDTPLNDASYVQSLTKRALELVSSPRTMDCLTGSSFFRLVAIKCVREQAMLLPLESKTTISRIENCLLNFLSQLLALIRRHANANKDNFFKSVATHPMYGLMQAMRSILTDVDLRPFSGSIEWRNFFADLLSVYVDIATIVMPVVAHSSPEGSQLVDGAAYSEFIVPMDDVSLNDDDSDRQSGFAPTAQLVLVCSWRSMKEVSLMLGDLVQRLNQSILTVEQIRKIGEFFTKLLKEAKHVGAFEISYAGFCKYCSTLWRSPLKELRDLPGSWADDVLVTLSTSTLSDSIIFTRRSAGLPYFVQALLSTEPETTGKPYLKSIMTGLLDICEATDISDSDKSLTLPQVHALNIIRDLYRDSLLAEDVAPFIARGMKTAIRGFSSNSWAVRNSSTLLYSSLISRTFGAARLKFEVSKQNCLTGREFFARFPSLYDFLAEELEKATENLDKKSSSESLHPSLHPILLLLSRLYPSVMEGPSSSHTLATFIPYIMKCRSSAIIKVRSVAADALPALVSLSQLPSAIKTLLDDIPSSGSRITSQNHLHGSLLQIKSLLGQRGDVEPLSSQPVQLALECLPSKFWIASNLNPCPMTRELCVATLKRCISNLNLCPAFCAMLEQIKASVRDLALATFKDAASTRSDTSVAATIGLSNYLTALADIYLSIADPASTKTFLTLLLSQKNQSVKRFACTFLEESLKNLRWEEVLESRLLDDVFSVADNSDLAKEVCKAMNEAVRKTSASELRLKTNICEILDFSLRTAKELWTSPNVGHCSLCLSASIVASLFDEKWPIHLGRSRLEALADLIVHFSSQEMVEELRMAAALSLTKTGHFSLLLTNEYPVDLSLRLWDACLLLLQDEDEAVRLETASNVANLQRQETPTPPILASRCFQLIPPILFSVFASSWSQELYDALMTWIRRHMHSETAGKDRRSSSRPALFIKGDVNPYYEATQTIDACVATLKMLVTKNDVIAVTTKDRTLALDLAKSIVAETQEPFSSEQQQRFLDLYAAVGIVRAFNDVIDLNESYLFNPALVSIV